MDVLADREQYVEKLRRLENGVSRILDLPSNNIVTMPIADELVKLKENAGLLRRKLESGEFEIAVVGLEKAGKSSFSNALSGLQILPTADARCTYTSTCIRPGEDNSATVSFLSKDELNRDLREKLSLLGIANAASWNLDNLSLEKYTQLYADCPQEKQRQYGDTVNEDIREMLANKNSLAGYLDKRPRHFNEAEINTPEFKSFITDPARAMAVKEVVIYSTRLQGMPNAVLYDVPGFDSPTEMHKRQTREKMNSADAIIAVANAKAPSLTQPALDVFKETDMEGSLLSDKLFVFANKSDLIRDAASFNENQETTREQWIGKRSLLKPEFAHRIQFGSAFAAEGDADAKAKLAELGLADGIEEMRTKLERYNENERFDVLKRRIGKLMVDVKKLFDGANSPTLDESGNFNAVYGKLLLDLMDRLRPHLREKLDALKHEMNGELETERPLSSDIQQRVQELVTTEKYALSPEEVQKKHEELHGVNTRAEMPPSVDTALRKSRFRQMYGEFCGQVQSSAVALHGDISGRIRDLFMQALNVQPGSEAYERLLPEVDNFCRLSINNDESYYDSLLERFARDLFEILILYSQGQERLNKFNAEKANYFSMGVYYDSGDLDAGESIPEDSSFWRLLLYPELTQAPRLSDALDMIKQESGLPQIGKPIQKLLAVLLARKGMDVVNILQKILRGLPRGSNEAAVAAALKEGLQYALSGIGDDVDSVLDDGYLRDVQERRGQHTYEKVREEFAHDIDALRLVLGRAFIPAVNMEKAFGARETRRLENIRDSLGSEDFRAFINNNIAIIEAAKIGELNMAESQRKANEAVRNEINAILAGMEKNS